MDSVSRMLANPGSTDQLRSASRGLRPRDNDHVREGMDRADLQSADSQGHPALLASHRANQLFADGQLRAVPSRQQRLTDCSSQSCHRFAPGQGGNSDGALDAIQACLDLAGFFPVLGAVADVANALISFARGNPIAAALSVVAAIPGAGDAVAGGVKVGMRGARMVGIKSVEEALPHIKKGIDWLSGMLGKLPPQLPSWARKALGELVEKCRNKLASLGARQGREGLLKELGKKGVKHTPENVVGISRRAEDGAVVFLEKGNSKAGLQHITEKHGADFARAGIPQEEIKDVVMKAATQGKKVGIQGRAPGRPVYEVEWKGKTVRVAVSVGDNGFIVGANPVSMR